MEKRGGMGTILMDDRRDPKISKSRLEALVDGIFAFAMTLLVTGLVIPHLSKGEAKARLAVSIAEMRSEFTSFLVAFFVLASFWQMHNRQFHYVRAVDSGIVRITLFILACVVLMPFTTIISGVYSDVQIAVNLFHANMFSLGVLFLVHWRHLARTPEITSVEIGSRDASSGMTRTLITPAISILAFILSFITPPWSMATYLLIIPSVAIARRYSQLKI
ncbi:MAG TPA: TMEM175 family protein [Syntrophorhabdaceae bacterium]|nr:TMEM175 family protein [Syntrophorhabdaceae bacterium]HQM81292.1 TMEM175 family protein [Syntrophorhabdaceae bacterium]